MEKLYSIIKIKARKVVKTCIKKRLTISIAESCTGGLLSSFITSIPGSSKVLFESVISYSNHSKISRLGVPEKTILKYGAVSKEVAELMAKGIKKDSNIGIGITGIAGPSGGTKDKKVGLVFFGVSFDNSIYVKKLNIKGTRDRIRLITCFKVLVFIEKMINKSLKQD